MNACTGARRSGCSRSSLPRVAGSSRLDSRMSVHVASSASISSSSATNRLPAGAAGAARRTAGRRQCGHSAAASSSCSVSVGQLLQRVHPLEKVVELPPGQQVDRRQRLELLPPAVSQEPALAPFLVDAEPGARVQRQVRLHVGALHVRELPLRLRAEAGRGARRRIDDLGEKILAHRSQPRNPLVVRGQARPRRRGRTTRRWRSCRPARAGLRPLAGRRGRRVAPRPPAGRAGSSSARPGTRMPAAPRESPWPRRACPAGRRSPARRGAGGPRNAALPRGPDGAVTRRFTRAPTAFCSSRDRLVLPLGHELRHARRQLQQLEERRPAPGRPTPSAARRA